jgi:Zn-dependent peptidase ImmA (M78 family)/transcriptional regulator with XRE-family HTH domain
MTPISGDALRIVRMARGWTQGDLARASGLSQATISKAESGVVVIDDVKRADQLAAALGVPLSLLTSNLGDQVDTACVFHRKRSSTSVAQSRKARAQLAIVRHRVEALFELVGHPASRLQRQSPTDDGFVSPADVALDTRKLLALGTAPIESLVGSMESAGTAVVGLPLGSDRLDALSDWPMAGWPVILVNSSVAGERQRFTAAHELGHAVMHSEVLRLPNADSKTPSDLPGRDENKEREADIFAAELLVPTAEARSELAQFRLTDLPQLKQKWKVSRAMLARRARDVGAISDNQYRRIVTEMSAAGWRTREPDPLVAETPVLLTSLVSHASRTHGADVVAAALHAIPSALDEVFAR